LLRLELARLAPLRAPVLIHGETGTGKELAARALHDCSARRGPFVAVNCGALTPTIVEDILFGHERGSFTGAATSHRGVFERARGGTLFLDEIGELPLPQQATLLRVLDDGRVCRIGAEQEHAVEVRLVAATNRDLGAAVERGELREDLYHRLAALRVETPALRDRPADIAPLARWFLDRIADEVGPRELTPGALELLAAHPWPGNARELRNALYRAAVSAAGATIRAGDLELDPPRRAPRRTAFRLDQLRDGRLEELLERHRGNVAAAARELGVARSTLRDRLKRLRQPRPGATAG
jgi:two-component system response regulator FlrC